MFEKNMRRNAALLRWKSYNDEAVSVKAGISINSILTAVVFASLIPAATTAKDQLKDYDESLEGARTGARNLIAIKNANKKLLANIMNNLSVLVNGIAQGDLAILLESMLPLNKPANSPVAQQKPLGVTVVNGKNSGEVIVSVAEALGAYALIFQYSIDPITPESLWTSKGTKRKSYPFSNLPSGAKIWFRVVSVGKDDVEIMSEVVSTIIL
jgi:hypothetical protein